MRRGKVTDRLHSDYQIGIGGTKDKKEEWKDEAHEAEWSEAAWIMI